MPTRPAVAPPRRPDPPPFDPGTAGAKFCAAEDAEDAWNSREPARVALAYTPDSRWCNRAGLLRGGDEIEAFLICKWAHGRDHRPIEELWAFEGNRIAVRFACERHDDSGRRFRS